MGKLIIVQGVPGSGKSTFVASLLKEATDQGDNAYVFSADHYFMKDGKYNFNPSLLGEAHKACKKNALDVMQNENAVVIIDNTNTTVLELAFYVELAAVLSYEVELYTIACDDLEGAAARNVHGVPLAAIKRMAENIERFKLPPYWNVAHCKVYGMKDATGAVSYCTSILKGLKG